MKISFVKNIMLCTALLGGLMFTSCKEKTEDNMETDTEVLEPMDPTYDEDQDTIMTEVDTITEANREHDEFELHKQVP